MAAYATETAITTSKVTYYDKTVDSLGPQEWTISCDQDVNVYLTGAFPGPGTAILLRTADGARAIGMPGRGITKIEAEAVTTTGTLKLIPTIL